MAMTRTEFTAGGKKIERWVETGSANTALTASAGASPSRVRRLLYATAKYSAAPTQAGVSVTLNAEAGAAYDAALETGSANAQTTVMFPDGDLWLVPGDVIDVLAPAGGIGITAAVAIYFDISNN